VSGTVKVNHQKIVFGKLSCLHQVYAVWQKVITLSGAYTRRHFQFYFKTFFKDQKKFRNNIDFSEGE
jgi:hypothetical protein